jgi:hypothetical protein
MTRLPGQKGAADAGLTTLGMASNGMVVFDGDGIMFGARWYALAGGMNLPGTFANVSDRS